MAQHQRPIGPTGTNTAATFAPNMVSDARPQRPQLGKPQPLGWVTSQTTHVAAPFSVEMIAGARPSSPRLPFVAKQGWSVSQTTHTSAPFSVDMVSDTRPQVNRAWLAKRSIYAVVPPDVLVFSVEMAQGWHPDRPQLAKPFPQGWSVTQHTHTSAPVSVEMLAGWHPDRNRATRGMQLQSAAIGPLDTTTGPVLVQPRGSRYQWKFHDSTIYK